MAADLIAFDAKNDVSAGALIRRMLLTFVSSFVALIALGIPIGVNAAAAEQVAAAAEKETPSERFKSLGLQFETELRAYQQDLAEFEARQQLTTEAEARHDLDSLRQMCPGTLKLNRRMLARGTLMIEIGVKLHNSLIAQAEASRIDFSKNQDLNALRVGIVATRLEAKKARITAIKLKHHCARLGVLAAQLEE